MQLLIEKEITNNGIVPASRISCVPFKSKLSFCNNWSISLLNDFDDEMSLLVTDGRVHINRVSQVLEVLKVLRNFEKSF